MKYVIVNRETTDPAVDLGSPLFWSNEFGWAGTEDADTFTEEQKAEFNLPLEGVWAEKQDALYFFHDWLGTHAPNRPCKCRGQCTGGK